MFFAVVECPRKSLEVIFMKGKRLNVVTAVNGFAECIYIYAALILHYLQHCHTLSLE